MAETQQALGSDEITTLKELALAGALDGEEKLSCSALAGRLDVSNQTASRRLQQLETGDYITREIVGDGQWIEITAAGEQRLQAEYASYQQIFEGEQTVDLRGAVTSGMGEGRHYITLSGYMEQFREELGYEPFAGTLNVDLTGDSIRSRARLDAFDPITIEGWESEERTYGPAYCYPATISVGGVEYEQAHVISPARTHHGDDHLEIIAPDELRETLGLEDGTEVMVSVAQQ
jgi:riboflavin kinase